MPPKIPQLKRENATLRNEGSQDPPKEKAGTNQKIPQTHSPLHPKVWFADQEKDPQHDLNEKT